MYLLRNIVRCRFIFTESSSNLGENDFNEVDEPDGISQKKLVDAEAEGVEMESSPSPVEKKKPRIFTLRLVNSYGSADFDKIVDDGIPVKFSSKTWHRCDTSLFKQESNTYVWIIIVIIIAIIIVITF